MVRYATCIFLALSYLAGAVLIDRIAVIVGTHVVKASDVDRDLRLTSFINRQQMDFTSAAKRKAADRLVDQQIIRQGTFGPGIQPGFR